MQQAQPGNTVRVHYTGTLDDGQVFDTSRSRAPLEFELGAGQVIPGFDEAVRGMQVGEAKQVTIPAESAYGPRRNELLLPVEREQLPSGMDPSVGQQLQVRQGDQSFVATIREVSDDSVVLDANHPLAGQDLTFDLELVEIR